MKYPIIILILLALAVGALEYLIMVVIHDPDIPHGYLAFLDSVLLFTLITPVIYFLVYKPLNMQLEKQRQLGREKEKLIEELEASGKEIKTLRDIIPICYSCMKIRDDEGLWKRLEEYFHEHTDVDFSHCLCPDCYQDEIQRIKKHKPVG